VYGRFATQTEFIRQTTFQKHKPVVGGCAIAAASPDGLAVVVAEKKLVVAALYLPGKDRFYAFELDSGACDLQFVTRMKDKVVLVYKTGRRIFRK